MHAPHAGNGAPALEHLQEIEQRIERLEKTVGTAVDLLHRLLHPDRVGKPGTPANR